MTALSGPKYVVLGCFIFSLHETFVTTVTTYMVTFDETLFFENMGSALIITAITIIAFTFLHHKDKFEFIWSALGSKRHQYEVDNETKFYIEKIRQRSSREKKYSPKLFIVLMVSACFVQIFVRYPLDTYLNGYEKYGRFSELLPKYVVGGVPIPFWYYFDTKVSDAAYYIAVGREVVFFVFMTSIVIASDCSFMCVAYEICTEFQILQYVLKNLVEISKLMCKSQGKDSPKYEDISPVLLSLLKSSIRHHQLLLRMGVTLKFIHRPTLIYLLVAISILVGSFGFLLQSSKVALGAQIAGCGTAMAAMFHLLIFCWFSEKMKVCSSQVGHNLFTPSIMDYTAILKKEFVIIQMRSTKPTVLSVSIKSELNLETFAGIMQTAYSYCNLMVSSSEKL
ncbi:uncharacterized protein LOC106662066 [Cimex lectularius]|uniref:Odorant receptor n=1 Tax=Cimex lectularius TaxID=79782 RepID=A0A8I6R978_CIMLE|nr:uncharacterized protein LOC106662066 [Cimex lectularius]